MWKVIRFLHCKLQAKAPLALHVYGRQYLHAGTAAVCEPALSLLHTTVANFLYDGNENEGYDTRAISTLTLLPSPILPNPERQLWGIQGENGSKSS